MLEINLDKENKIVTLEPHGALTQDDFQSVAKIIDPFIEESGNLNGVIIYTKSFPGWESFTALTDHLKFVREHHKEISYVAFVTDSIIGDFGQKIANHFVKATVKNFSYNDLNSAKAWILES